MSTLVAEQQNVHGCDITRTNNEGQQDIVTDNVASPEGLEARKAYLRSYKIDVSEQLYVFATLVRLHLRKWQAFLKRVKSVVSRLELATQSSMLEDLDRSIYIQQDTCTSLLFDVEV